MIIIFKSGFDFPLKPRSNELESRWQLMRAQILILLFDRQLSCTLIDSRALSSTWDMFRISMRFSLSFDHQLSCAVINFEHVQNFDENCREFVKRLSPIVLDSRSHLRLTKSGHSTLKQLSRATKSIDLH